VNTNIIILIAALIGASILLSLYPSIDGMVQNVGNRMASGANYTIDSGTTDSVKTNLWAVAGGLAILALFADLYAGQKNGG